MYTAEYTPFEACSHFHEAATHGVTNDSRSAVQDGRIDAGIRLRRSLLAFLAALSPSRLGMLPDARFGPAESFQKATRPGMSALLRDGAFKNPSTSNGS